MALNKTTEHRPSRDHHHEMSLDDTFDFLNTIELESGSLVDHFETFDDAADWLIGRGVCHSGRGPAALRAPAGGPWAGRCEALPPRSAVGGRPTQTPSLKSIGRSPPASESSSSARPTAC